MPIPPLASAASLFGGAAEGLSSGLQLAMQMKQLQQQMEIERAREQRAMRMFDMDVARNQREGQEWEYEHGLIPPASLGPWKEQYPGLPDDIHRHDLPGLSPDWKLKDIEADNEINALRARAAKIRAEAMAGKKPDDLELKFWMELAQQAAKEMGDPMHGASGRARAKEKFDMAMDVLNAKGFRFGPEGQPVQGQPTPLPGPGMGLVPSSTPNPLVGGTAGQPASAGVQYGPKNRARMAQGKQPIPPFDQ